MSAIVIQRCHRLADSLAELKIKVRAALATELAAAIGTAVRDMLVVALVDHLITPTRTAPPRPPSSHTASWRDDEDDRERDQWGYPRDPWGEPDETQDRTPIRYACDEPEEIERMPAVPAAAALAIGVQASRWWLACKGTVAAAVGIGLFATGLGLAGGPVARAALAVLAATGDLLTAESALSRINPS